MSSALILLCFMSKQAAAHESRPAYLQIIQTDDSSYNVYWKVPRLGDKVPKIQPTFSPTIDSKTIQPPQQLTGSVLYSFQLLTTKPLSSHKLEISGLNKTLIDVLITIKYINGETVTFMLQPEKNVRIIPNETTGLDVISTYTVLGFKHILLGIDHLFFVLALLLITAGKTSIIKTITAFTVAHSITLSLTALSYISVPTAPIEAVIALSIVFLALEILSVQNGKQTLTSRKPWLVAFTFGLLHGFGFAGALAQIGLPQTEIPLALAFFNIGVELGQIAFIFCALLIFKLLSLRKQWPVYAKKTPAYAIGGIASFWLIERIALFI